MAHMTKHDLKHDEMADIGEKLSAWYERNQRMVTTLLAVLLVALVGWKVYDRWHDSRLATANIRYGTILTNYQTAIGQTEEKERKELFNTVLTEAERFIDQYGRLEIAEAVQLIRGNAHYYLAATYANDATQAKPERQKALEAFQKYLSMADTNQEKAVAQLAIGNVLENQLFTEKNVDLQRDVLTAYDEAIRLGKGTYLESEAKMAKGRLLTALEGRQDDAKRLFAEVADSSTTSAVVEAQPTPALRRELTPEEKIAEENARKINKLMEVSYASQAEQALKRIDGMQPAQ
jgi:predicted negative regulator of RcsB-dependent stress response